jgi:predicted Fe-Mo cluster-binding NifX family protein
MKTLVAVTAQNRKTIFEHAGKCRNFLIYTIEDDNITNKKLLELTKEESLHNVLHDANATSVLYDVDILLTRGIGNGAIQKLAKQNVACYKIEETDPDTAIDKLIKGTLEAVAPVSHESHNSCSNHHQNHAHQHEDGHSCGCH